MLHKTISLNEYYPFLGENGCDPKLTLYLHEKHPEVKRKTEKLPCLLICPGGGYGSAAADSGKSQGHRTGSCELYCLWKGDP